MNAWTRTNLLLGVLAAVLLAARLWPHAAPPLQLLTALSAEGVTTLRIERADRLEIALERQAGGWRLVYPHNAPAVQRRVDQLLAIVQAPVQYSYPAADNLEHYGLAPPRAVLQLDSLRIPFGERDPSQHLRYVLSGERIQVIDDVYFNLLTLPPRHFTGD